jgi:hypothetical protein
VIELARSPSNTAPADMPAPSDSEVAVVTGAGVPTDRSKTDAGEWSMTEPVGRPIPDGVRAAGRVFPRTSTGEARR